MTRTLARTSALVLLLSFAASCKGVAPKPVQAGDWHLEGSSAALYSKTDGGDFGDTDTLDVQITGGVFALDQLLVEAIFGVSDSTFEDGSTSDETTTTTMDMGFGARYYPMPEGSSRPYLGIRSGLSHINVDDEFTGLDESDTSPFFEARLGLEAFVSTSAAVDMGVRWQEVFSRDLGSSDDDLSTFGIFLGLSIWL
jgi:opacity protein-like surface antigen